MKTQANCLIVIPAIEVRDPTLLGVPLHDLRLLPGYPGVSVRRNGHVLISHGYTRLEKGDRLAVVGSLKSLEEVTLLLET